MNTENKSGGILVMVMVVLVAFSVLAGGLFNLYQLDAVETIYVEQGNQAFWVAEAGLQRVLSKLRTSTSYREDIVDFHNGQGSADTETDTVEDGSYSVDVWREGSENNFRLLSKGIVQSQSRRILLSATLSDFGDFSIAVLNGTITSDMGKDSTIISNVYMKGKFDASGIDIKGTVYSSDPSKPDTWVDIPEDGKLELDIKSEYFDDYFVKADSGSLTYPIVLTNYPGNTLVVSQNVNVNHAGGIVGPGTLVIKNNHNLTASKDFTVGNNITIVVDGNIDVKKEPTFGNNVVVYAKGYIDMAKTATGSGCIFMSEGNMNFKKGLDFDGLLFTKGALYTDKDFTVDGSVITENGFSMKKNATVTFNAGVIPGGVASLLTSTYFVQSSTWVELPSD